MIFSMMLGVLLISEVYGTSKELIGYQVQYHATHSESVGEFKQKLINEGFFESVSLKKLDTTVSTSVSINGSSTSNLIVSIGKTSYIVSFKHVYLARVISKFLMVIMFALAGSYIVIRIFNNAKIESISQQIAQLYSSVENLSKGKLQSQKNEVAEFQVLQDLLKDIDANITSERIELINKAEVDHLTQVYNKLAFDKKLKALESAYLTSVKPIGVLYFDLNNFKTLNDTHGHTFGDNVLIKFATILKSCIRKDDTAFRLGGDEFAVIVENGVTEKSIANLRGFLQERLNVKILIDDIEVNLSCVMGVGIYPFHVSKIEGLLPFADKDMYKQKAIFKSKNNVEQIKKVSG